MKHKQYIKLTANKVATIKQSYYDEMDSIKNIMVDYSRESSVNKVLIIDIDEELKCIKTAIKNTILQIKLLDNNIEIEDDIVNDLQKDINKYYSTDKKNTLNYKIKELEKMKNNLILLEKRKKELLNRKRELLKNKKNAKSNIRFINKNMKLCENNLNSINISLISLDSISINFNGYIDNKKLKPKLKKMKKMK